MSTRSGKRLHNASAVNEECSKSSNTRRTLRGRRKDVTEPVPGEFVRALAPRRNTLLKELNFDKTSANNEDDELTTSVREADKSSLRETRRTKKFHIENQELIESTVNDRVNNIKSNKKKNKKKKSDTISNVENMDTGRGQEQRKKKKGKNKKKNKNIVEPVKSDIVEQTEMKPKISNVSATSVDSFHSATESPKVVSTEQDNTASSRSQIDIVSKLDTTFDKDNDDKTSIISSDRSDVKDAVFNATYDKSDLSRISITSDDSKKSINSEHFIMNATPVLIESSMETSNTSINGVFTTPPALQREGTFTKDGPDPIIITEKARITITPDKNRISLPAPGSTPYHSNGKKRTLSTNLNLTHSVEKPTTRSARSSIIGILQRTTKVMFCSPVDNSSLDTQRKSKIIKSSMKGSNKSFLFDQDTSMLPSARKRSFTHNDVDELRAKRKKLGGDELRDSVNRLSKPRTSGAAKSNEPVTPSKKVTTPYISKSESKPARSKLPNFAALHQKRFEKMESLDECQERKAKRAKQLLSPSGSLAVLERSARKDKSASKQETKPAITQKQETATKSVGKLPTLDSLRPGYTRFGFKMNYDINPFSVPSKDKSISKTAAKPKPINNTLRRDYTLPSLVGVTSQRKVAAKQLVLREKSTTSLREKQDSKRNDNRVTIKGVRTNRRFELQMKSRNINN